MAGGFFVLVKRKGPYECGPLFCFISSDHGRNFDKSFGRNLHKSKCPPSSLGTQQGSCSLDSEFALNKWIQYQSMQKIPTSMREFEFPPRRFLLQLQRSRIQPFPTQISSEAKDSFDTSDLVKQAIKKSAKSPRFCLSIGHRSAKPACWPYCRASKISCLWICHPSSASNNAR